MLEAVNSWAHKVRVEVRKKAKNDPDLNVEKAAKFVEGRSKPRTSKSLDEPIVVQSFKDAERVAQNIQPLPSSRKSLAKIINRVHKHVVLEHDEKLVMVDSGAFTHAIHAEEELPDHQLVPFGPDEHSPDGETACGGIIKCTGKVCTKGVVEGLALDIKWNSMPVKVPILSVRKLVRSQHHVRFHDKGGYIKCLRTGARIPFFQHQGVYYLKMRFLPPSPSSPPVEPLFSRPVP